MIWNIFQLCMFLAIILLIAFSVIVAALYSFEIRMREMDNR